MSCGCLKPKCSSPAPVEFSVCVNDGRDVEFVPLTEFLPQVRVVAQGVPDDVALEWIGAALIEFARNTKILRRIAVISVQAGVRDYYIEAGDNEQVHLVHGLDYGHYHSHLSESLDNLRSYMFGQNGCGCQGCNVPIQRCDNHIYNFEPPNKIVLKKTPMVDKEAVLRMDYVAIPTQSTCEVDKLIFDRYQSTIVAGALANLLLFRKYDFADTQLASVFERKYKIGENQAKIDVVSQFKQVFQSMQNTWRV